MPDVTTVHILLATFNGGRFLAQQLASLARQTHTDWTLTVSDDGSDDDTLAIVARFASQVPQTVTVLRGPGRGVTRNFFHLIGNTPGCEKGDLYAFCDQDDVWLDDKLKRAVAWHSAHASSPVRLYCGRTQYVNEALAPLGTSRALQRPPGFGNALVQNIASGNTMVLDAALMQGLRQVHPTHSVWHDWTTYLVAAALGGMVHFDDSPGVLYRQHAHNVIGANEGLRAQLRRLGPVLTGRYRQWSDTNVQAMHDVQALLTPTAAQCLKDFELMRRQPFALQRLALLLRSPVRRQGFLSNAVLALAVCLDLA